MPSQAPQASSGSRSIPASFFGIILGLVGLGDCWRVAHHAWGLPHWAGETIMLASFGIWVLLLGLYITKWIWQRNEAIAEWRHPFQSCYIGLSGVSTALAAVAIAPYLHGLAIVLFAVGSTAQLLYGLIFTGRSLQGNSEVSLISPALYLPTVAGNFVSSFVAGYLHFTSLGIIFFGAGLLSWLSLESLINGRLNYGKSLPVALRPSLGILLAPPVVGLIGYLFVTGGIEGAKPGLFPQLLFGYGLFQLLLLVRMMPWITTQRFVASYWAFSFGITAIAFDAIVFILRGDNGLAAQLAPALFILANGVLTLLIIGTIVKLVHGNLLPPTLTS
ncbi:MAG: dicarboxylate transporter/tellurite-resistance protein TehA [Cyanobacteria bacterium]|nr:dicarboxylate transporter/tellurite-resistance protein TehA [Cyanobacteriota bacterium]